jgi:hypothetical protein
VLCDGVIDRFLGLPGALDRAKSPAAGRALAGRWWIRACSAQRNGSEVRLHLEGPGWYWVDAHDGGLSVQQQVPFSLSLTLDNRIQGGVQDGVFSLWLEPAREPQVELRLREQPQVRGSSAWGSLLAWALPVREMASERISESASHSLREQLKDGVTLTYDFQSGSSDATVGRLAEGQVPSHPFEGSEAWTVNERLALAPASTHVVGPLEPGASRIDLRVERGSGVAYRGVCAEDMTAYFDAIASARLADIPSPALATTGAIVGAGDHEATLRVDGCRYFLVLSPWQGLDTVAALRVRG